MEVEFRHCDLEIKDIVILKNEKETISFSQINDILVKLTINVADTLTKAIEYLTKNYDEFIKEYNENLFIARLHTASYEPDGKM